VWLQMTQIKDSNRPVLIEGDGFESAWFKLLVHVLQGQTVRDVRGNETKEVLNCVTYIANAQSKKYPQRFVEMANKTEYKVALLEALAEPSLDWKPCSRLKEYPAPKSATINQIEHLVKMINKWPTTRRAVASTYYPPEDCNGSLEVIGYDLPAIQIIDLKARGGRLNLTCYFRSSEVYFWWPINAYQLTKLMEELAPQCSLESGDLTMVLASAHIIEKNLKEAQSAASELGKIATKSATRLISR
jgi:thymidylate synthase